jgi:hypothetical protein
MSTTEARAKLKRARYFALGALVVATALAALTVYRQLWFLLAVNVAIIGAELIMLFRLRYIRRDLDEIDALHGNVTMVQALQRDICPDCGTVGMTPGPCGGASMNVSCPSCGARFNAMGGNIGDSRDLRGTFAAQRITAHTLH